jgi:hypothetical protein
MLRLSGVETGENALAPGKVIPGRGFLRNYGQWGFIAPAIGPPVGATLHVPCRRRDRMGFGGAAGQHRRHQREWHVHRISRHALDWRGFYRTAESRTPDENRLFGEARRTRPGNGRGRRALGNGNPKALPRPSFRAIHHKTLTPPYTEGEHSLNAPRFRICRKSSGVVFNEA